MGDPHPSSSSLREPLLDPEVVENSNYFVQCRSRSENSLGLEDVLRSWYDQNDLLVSQGVAGEAVDGIIPSADGDDPEGTMYRSERSCRPWYRNPLQIMAMISNFSTSFNVVNISLVLPILKVVLQNIHPVTAEDESMLASSLIFGMVLGQLVGGVLGDSVLGLAGALALVMLLQLVASIGSAFVPVHSHNFYWTLATWRFVLGIGAGAVYPLAACLSVEQGHPSSCKDHEALRLKRVVWTFAMQGVGFWIVPALAAALVYSNMRLELVWRVLLGAGCLPGIALLYLQYRVLVYQPTTNLMVEAMSQVTTDEEQIAFDYDLAPTTDTPVPADEVEMGKNAPNNQGAPSSASLNEQILGAGDRQHNTPNSLPRPLGNGMPLGQYIRIRSSPQLRALAGMHSAQRQESGRNEEDQAPGQENTDMPDRDLHDDSDGEVGTFLDSSPDLDMSSAGIYRESEPPVISTGWLVSLQTEERLCRKLLGTAVTWFLFDVLFYGNTLFQPIVIEQAFGSRKALAAEALIRRVVGDSLVLNSIALPGYFVAALLIGKKTFGVKQSPRYVMLQGFAGMAILYFIIALSWHPLRNFPILLVFLYGLTFFFANYGPNTTTFVLPSLVYSAECRSTFNGICAACGKLGALVGATMFAPLDKKVHEEAVMLMCAFTALVAFAMTAFFVRLRATPTENPRPGHGRYSVEELPPADLDVNESST
eukprot:scaffold6886_cov164-Amphora_coffeaeformis.AAC.6